MQRRKSPAAHENTTTKRRKYMNQHHSFYQNKRLGMGKYIVNYRDILKNGTFARISDLIEEACLHPELIKTPDTVQEEDYASGHASVGRAPFPAKRALSDGELLCGKDLQQGTAE